MTPESNFCEVCGAFCTLQTKTFSKQVGNFPLEVLQLYTLGLPNYVTVDSVKIPQDALQWLDTQTMLGSLYRKHIELKKMSHVASQHFELKTF